MPTTYKVKIKRKTNVANEVMNQTFHAAVASVQPVPPDIGIKCTRNINLPVKIAFGSNFGGILRLLLTTDEVLDELIQHDQRVAPDRRCGGS